MGFFSNFGKSASGRDGRPNIDPVLAGFEEAGYLIEIVHIASGKAAVFPSWITDFTDNYTSEWNGETVFGRNDKIGTFQGTSRTISVSLEIPSYSVVEARENMHQLEHLIANLYPSYKQESGVYTMQGSPLVKVKFANLIKNANVRSNAVNAAKGGLSGWISNVTFSPNLEAGFHHMSPNMSKRDQADYNGVFEGKKELNASHTFLPKVLNVSFSLSVVHEHKLGWEQVGKDKKAKWLGEVDSFPYGVEQLSGKQHALDKDAKATTRTGGRVAKGLISKVFKGKASL